MVYVLQVDIELKGDFGDGDIENNSRQKIREEI